MYLWSHHNKYSVQNDKQAACCHAGCTVRHAYETYPFHIGHRCSTPPVSLLISQIRKSVRQVRQIRHFRSFRTRSIDINMDGKKGATEAVGPSPTGAYYPSDGDKWIEHDHVQANVLWVMNSVVLFFIIFIFIIFLITLFFFASVDPGNVSVRGPTLLHHLYTSFATSPNCIAIAEPWVLVNHGLRSIFSFNHTQLGQCLTWVARLCLSLAAAVGLDLHSALLWQRLERQSLSLHGTKNVPHLRYIATLSEVWHTTFVG